MDRRAFLHHAVATAASVATSAALAAQTSDPRGAHIASLMTELHRQRLFTGAVLVARRGVVVHQSAHGAADVTSGRPYTVGTRACLASVSKPITAVAVMMLAARGRVQYDQPMTRHLAGFTPEMGAVTLRHLLTHTSGIPDYPQLHVDRPGVTNLEILAALRKVPRPSFAPGEAYAYSNSGYVLLALVVESVAGVPFPRFLQTHIFDPLGMRDTFVLTDRAQKVGDVARGYDRAGQSDDFEGMATGESGVYSTVGDLLRFDQALYTDALVTQRALTAAFTPAGVRRGTTTYGLGWNITTDETGVRVWHQGNTAGFRALLERRLRDRITTIMLANGGDTNRMAISDRIQRIMRAA
jgi:CubicO group peptidase (beta-lactamase class C family)